MYFIFIAAILSSFIFEISTFASNVEECKKISETVASSKDLHPDQFSQYLGKERKDFPCEENGGEGAGSSYSVRTYKLGSRTMAVLTKEGSRSIILDAILLPALAKSETLIGTSFCIHKVPKAPAIAIEKKSKAGKKIKYAWVIDREVEKILKVSSSAIKCDSDSGNEL